MTTLTRPGHHRGDPRTSVEADLLHRASGKTETHQNKVLEAVRAHPGLTRTQYGELTGLDKYEAARRLSDLHARGLVEHVQARKGEREGTWQAVGGALTQGSLL